MCSLLEQGVVSKDEFTANLIKGIRIIFEPEDLIKERIAKTRINLAMAV